MSDAMEIAKKVTEHEFEIQKEEVDKLTRKVMENNTDRPNIVELSKKKLMFIGDLHGELDSILSVQSILKKYRDYTFVFLGDYGDRGNRQVDTFNLVISLHLLNPERVVILRGNHESEEIARRYGFEMAVQRKFDRNTFNYYVRVFESIPIGVISKNGVFGCHGGIPEGVQSLEDLQEPDRHHSNFPSDILFQMVWNDPQEADFDFRPNMRSRRARNYGRRAFERFSKNLSIDLMVRAHEAYRLGYQKYFNGQLISIFSASYQGQSRPTILRVGESLETEFLTLEA